MKDGELDGGRRPRVGGARAMVIKMKQIQESVARC